MIFAFSNKSVQKIEDSQTKGMQTLEVNNSSMFKPSGAPEKIEYVGKLNIGAINERAFDDLTGASYVSDIFNGYSVESQCQFVASMAGWTFGTIAGAVTSFFVPVAAPAATWIAKTAASTIMRRECRDSLGSDQSTNSSVADTETIDDVGTVGSDNGDNNGDNDGDNDNNNENENDNGDGDNDDTNTDADSDVQEESNEEQDDSGDGGNDDPGAAEGNPNPFDTSGSDGPNIPRRPPGDVGGKYGDIFNPGAERGFTPGDGGDGDGNPGNPGNPWDRDERMSTPNDGDPITGDESGPKGPNPGPGPSDPDDDYGNGGPLDGFYKPNPDEDWGGGGPNSKSLEGNEFEKIFEFAGTKSFDSNSDFQAKDQMLTAMSVDTFGL